MFRIIVLSLFLLVLPGCGGTWIDDNRNFNRVFNFDKPPEVNVIHSYYWKSSHWSAEYQYFIALHAPDSFVDRLTNASLMNPADPDEEMVSACGDNRPRWFLPSGLANYKVWTPKSEDRYRVFRDKADGTLFVCDERL